MHSRPPSRAGPVVALGKFDALHRGHQALAIAAGRLGAPVLLSFSGMGQVLGWPQRMPLVAPPDRARVLASWADACDGAAPRLRTIPFHLIRRMPPEEFVRLLAEQLGAKGVVAGRNYRFGACAPQSVGRSIGPLQAMQQPVWRMLRARVRLGLGPGGATSAGAPVALQLNSPACALLRVTDQHASLGRRACAPAAAI